MHGHTHHLGDFLAKRIDVLALLADDDTGTRGVNDDSRILGRTLNFDTTDGRVSEFLANELAYCDIRVQIVRIVAAFGVPDGIPVLDYAKAKSDWIDFLTHRALAQISDTVSVMWLVRFMM